METMDFKDEFIQFLDKIVKVETEGHRLPLYGRLVALSWLFLTFERKDGRRVLIRRHEVRTIEPVRNQSPVVD